MNELITSSGARGDIRWQLLATASALALCGAIFSSTADAQDSDRPTVWIEVGGQLERVQAQQDAFAPPFTLAHLNAPYNFVSPLELQRPPRYAFGGEGKISIQPAGTDWVFSAAVSYGRSNGSKDVHQQTVSQVRVHLGTVFYTRSAQHFDDTSSAHRESHAIVDFSAGKDVGLGLFGHDSHSVFQFGVRYAQFHTSSSTVLRSGPDLFIPTNAKYKPRHHQYYGHSDIEHDFSGIGPSLSLANSMPFVGNAQSGEVAFDWGANAALLFGRQKVRGTHETTGMYFNPIGCCATGFLPDSQYAAPPASPRRSRSVIVPNVGGFAGLTFQRADAKVKLGYRADFFFGALDGGSDTRHTSTLGFYGPFASISIGLGG